MIQYIDSFILPQYLNRSNTDDIVMEVIHREPLITPNKVDQFRQMIERLKEKLVPLNKHYYLFKVNLLYKEYIYYSFVLF